MHIQSPEQKSWIQRRVEGAPWNSHFDVAGKRKILTQLTEAEGFEAFCAKKYVSTKRFGLEGGESTIPAVQAVIETAAGLGVNEICIGMAHRGRLNVLVNVVKKPYMKVFSEFKGVSAAPPEVPSCAVGAQRFRGRFHRLRSRGLRGAPPARHWHLPGSQDAAASASRRLGRWSGMPGDRIRRELQPR
jgi:hypothetical protein